MNHVATICEVVNGFRIMHGTVRAVLRAVMKLPTHQISHDPGGAEAGDGAGVVPGVGLGMAASPPKKKKKKKQNQKKMIL